MIAETGYSDLFADLDTAETLARRQVRCGFVSTNSIVQGEQASVLWAWMLNQRLHIQFAHRTFKWTNDAPGRAAVHCVIVGFGATVVKKPLLADYATVDGEPLVRPVSAISPYLVEGGDFVVASRAQPLCDVPEAMYGSKPADGGHLVLSDEEKKALLKAEPEAKKFVRPLISAEEFLHGKKRWCLWLPDVSATELKQLPLVRARLAAVSQFRSASAKAQTRDLAAFPGLFAEVRQPKKRYIAVPLHSSETRNYIPMDFCKASDVLHNSCAAVPNATMYHFGVLMSAMHMAWVKTVCGRIKSDFRYSNNIVYNNFPWPLVIAVGDKPLPAKAIAKAHAAIELAAQAVLDARGMDPSASLADLYKLPMPVTLLKAHRKLDAAVDAAYALGAGQKTWKSDAERVAYLFKVYGHLTSL